MEPGELLEYGKFPEATVKNETMVEIPSDCCD